MTPSKKILILLSLFTLGSLTYATTTALNDFDHFIKETKITGLLKMYDFNRQYQKLPTQNAFSLGGGINVLTGEVVPGLRLDGEVYTAQPLGLNSQNSTHVDNTLPGYALTTIDQSYLQYQYKSFLIQGGNQVLNTPWINSVDSRMIPATYQGGYATLTPLQNLTLTALRLYRFKGRSENGFTRTNLYNPQNTGGTGIAAFGDTSDDGALALGIDYQNTALTAQSWYYQFYDFAQLFYADGKYNFTLSTLRPFIALQALRETGSGSNLLSPYEGGDADASGFGINSGISLHKLNLSLAYNTLFKASNSFKHGDIISPYTSGYADDPLYTTSMIAGLVEKSSGQALKFTANYPFFNSQLIALASFADYFTEPYLNDTSEIDGDIMYNFTGRLTGLSLRYRVGILNGNTTSGRFMYNRFMLQYKF